jgi:hypothetical protein
LRAVAISGYAAFGSEVSSDVLLNLRGAPAVVKAANMFVVVHVAAGYQVSMGGCFGGMLGSFAMSSRQGRQL